MKTIIHKAETRGFADHGWLKSYHTFSFSGYQNLERMNFGMLRVLNDDVVQPNMGFGTHPHKNMEIISIPISGALSHKDSMGNKRSIEVDEVQVMSAGTGLTHSEFNDSKTDAVNFLQIWIIPEHDDVTPYYNQKKFDKAGRQNTFQALVSPKDNLIEGTLPIHQQGYIYKIDLNKDKHQTYTLKNSAYVFVIKGNVIVEDVSLTNRDAAGFYNTEQVQIVAKEHSELLIIDVPVA